MRSSKTSATPPGLLVFFSLLVLLANFCRPTRAGVLAQLYGYSNGGCVDPLQEQGIIQPQTEDSKCYQFAKPVYSVYSIFQEDKDYCSYSVYTDYGCSEDNEVPAPWHDCQACSSGFRSYSYTCGHPGEILNFS
ncbi:hypothetical protein IWX91DRAFT_190617 [Phyllosticta citricarpa]